MSCINVLVVDDFPQNLVATEAMLARPGLTVLKASSGVEALELLLQHEVALALIDVQMPEMDGFALAELIRGNRRTAGIPLIFMTAAAAEGARTFRGYQAGAVDFLNKPVDPTVLRGKVEVFVQLQAQKEQIRQQVEELRHALKMNEMFIAVLGHDLRTPLSAVLHGSELMMHAAPDERLGQVARRIHASGERMEKMVRQLLDVARLRSGSVVLNHARASYRDVCERIIQEIEHVGAASRLRLECRGDVEADFDPDRMSQVISNLVANALQHGAPEGAVEIEVDGTHSARVRIRVNNRGAIPASLLPNLFRPFHADSEARTSSAGLGLGLYIVKRFVEAHEGSVNVQSDERDGTCFVMNIPRRVEAAA